MNDKKQNTITGFIYKHPKTSEFANNFMLTLLGKISLEKKEIVLMGAFNIKLL